MVDTAGLFYRVFGTKGSDFRVVLDGAVMDSSTLLKMSERLAGWLQSVTEKEAVVAFPSDGTFDYLVRYWAVLLAGRITLEIDAELPAPEIQARSGLVNPALMLGEQIPQDCSYVQSQCDLASIVFTSGTTGGLKAATLTRANLAFVTSAIAQSFSDLGTEGPEVFSGFLPFHYTYGKSILLLASLVGGTVVATERVLTARTMLGLIKRHGITHLSLVPTLARLLLREEDFQTQLLPSIRRVTIAGGALDADSLQSVLQRFPAKVITMYGLTEASTRVACMPAQDMERKFGSAGKALPGVEIQIGDQGEVLVRGPNVMKGYWNDPDSTRQAIKDDWLHTGDSGRLDDEGFLYLEGRLKDTIKSGGHSIAAGRVERVLLQCPGVEEVALVGKPDLDLGERLVAYVVASGLSADSLKNWCRTQLGQVMTPHDVIFRETLPRTSSGKIMKWKLKAEGSTE